MAEIFPGVTPAIFRHAVAAWHGWLDFASTRFKCARVLPMISSAEARQRAQENLEGFPPAIIDAYYAFAEKGDLARLDDVVFGVLQFYLAKPPSGPLVTLPGSTRLVQDLGCDSLTMADMIFRAEGLFAIKLIDEELARVVTLDDLREYFRRQVSRDGSGTVAA